MSVKNIIHTAKGSLYDPSFEHDACGIGFVANIKGIRSHEIIQQGLIVLKNLHHRGATGSEAATGDGAGILIQKPHEFLRQECAQIGIDLPSPEKYAVGMVFLPPDPRTRRSCEESFEEIIHREGQSVIGWRTVPTHPENLGPTAKYTAPVVRQIFIKCSLAIQDEAEFERKLFVIRKLAKKEIRDSGSIGGEYFYIPSLSYKTVVYKGMLTALQLESFYPELKNPLLDSSLVLIHSRFSTNTFPSWDRAHPYRFMVHNGEINTIRGNVNWFKTREKVFTSQLFGEDLKKTLPVLNYSGSDSAIFDNCLEFLHLAGRPIEEVMMMMIPEPWEKDKRMREERRAFYEFHSCLMEAWDGPAAIAFTDGVKIGAVLDRNGLRPGRYYVTKNDLVVMASECGVLDIPERDIIRKGRLKPGRMLLVDTVQGKLLTDFEIKSKIAAKNLL